MGDQFSKARFITAIQMGEPDRVPVFCQLSIGYILLNTDISPTDFLFTNTGYADALFSAYTDSGFDAILINNYHDKNPDFHNRVSRIEKKDDGEIVHWKNGRKTVCPVDDDPYEVDKQFTIESFDTFNPDSIDPDSVPPDYYFEPIRMINRRIGEQLAVVGEIACPFSCFMNRFGYENALMALMSDSAKLHEILGRLTQQQLNNAQRQLALNIDLLNFSSPYAGNGFISRTHYREFVQPYIKTIIREIRPCGTPTMIHTCGSIMDRLDLMADTGVSGIECMDPPPLGDGDLDVAKQQLGNRIFLKGNIDSVNILLKKTTAEVKRHAKKLIEIGAPGGGYILSTSCSVAPKVPSENLKILQQAAVEYGC